MADGSVTIGVSLDTTQFIHSIELLEDRVTGLGASLSTAVTNAVSGEKFYKSIENAYKIISSSAVEYSTAFKSAFTDAVDETIAYFETAPWSSGGKTVANGLADGIESAIPRVTAAMSHLLSAASAEFTASWNKIGQNIAAGISSGITDGTKDVEKSATQLSKYTGDAFKKYYQISSPSALMRDEVGVMIARGIADGITDGSSFVSSALSSVYSATDGMHPKTVASSDNRRTLTQNIYLRDGDASPYRTAKRIKRESEAMFRL